MDGDNPFWGLSHPCVVFFDQMEPTNGLGVGQGPRAGRVVSRSVAAAAWPAPPPNSSTPAQLPFLSLLPRDLPFPASCPPLLLLLK